MVYHVEGRWPTVSEAGSSRASLLRKGDLMQVYVGEGIPTAWPAGLPSNESVQAEQPHHIPRKERGTLMCVQGWGGGMVQGVKTSTITACPLNWDNPMGRALRLCPWRLIASGKPVPEGRKGPLLNLEARRRGEGGRRADL